MTPHQMTLEEFAARGMKAQAEVDKLCHIKPTSFDGRTYEDKLDGPRLRFQMERVREYMLAIFPQWKTLVEISMSLERKYKVRFPEASISARLRDLRKEKFGGYVVERKRRSAGTHEYLVYRR